MRIQKQLVFVSAGIIAVCSMCGEKTIARPPCRAAASAQVSATSVATVSAGVVAVPFAVPVAMPSYVQYSAHVATAAPEYQSHAPLAMPDAACAMPAPTSASASDSAGTARASSLVSTYCRQCHGAVQPKAGLDLSGALDNATRLKAITRILADDPRQRMPKGKELSAAELGRLIQELATSASPSATAEPAPALDNLDD
ncbi:MAG TPA: hypothetical protein VHD36_08430 [Pirellulales bacterium]|nr:hypothetical protein [Pirellulales bacterium]